VLHYDPIGRSWVKLTSVPVSINFFFVWCCALSAFSCFGRARFFFLPILVPHSLFSFHATSKIWRYTIESSQKQLLPAHNQLLTRRSEHVFINLFIAASISVLGIAHHGHPTGAEFPTSNSRYDQWSTSPYLYSAQRWQHSCRRCSLHPSSDQYRADGDDSPNWRRDCSSSCHTANCTALLPISR
jgi:hypothetical protein